MADIALGCRPCVKCAIKRGQEMRDSPWSADVSLNPIGFKLKFSLIQSVKPILR